VSTVTLGVSADVATRSDGLAAGAGPHLPVGYWSGVKYRSAMRFIAPAGWAGWTSIDKATLTFYISDHQHVGVKNSSIYVRRCSTSDIWNKAAGSQSCDSGFTSGNTSQYADLAAVSSNQASFSSGTTANATKSFGVTAMVRDYQAVGSSYIVFIFDPVGSDDYTELWADEKSGYTVQLEIDYTDVSVPTAPTLVYPAAGASITEQTPDFDWTPTGDGPQTNAEVQLYDNTGTAIGSPWAVAGATSHLVSPTTLTRGTLYQWAVRTQNAQGWGPFTTRRSFTVLGNPTVTIDTTRRMEFGAGAPRLRVNWTSSQPQVKYRIQTASPVYDSGWVTSTVQSVRLDAVALTSGTAVNVTVSVEAAGALQGSASQSFTPRYGLTSHRKDLGVAPLNWGSPLAVATIPLDSQLVFEYGSAALANASPTGGWYSTLSAVPKLRYLYWRAWFIPNATTGPTLDKLTIPADSTVTLVDKWGTTRDTPGLTAPWAIDPGEFVYGTRSMVADIGGAGPYKVYGYGVKVRAGRSYILTGLMKSQGNSGAAFQLEDGAGNLLQGGGMILPPGPVRSEVLVADRDWFDAESRDVNRYKTPIWLAPSDMTVYVVLVAGGTSGAKAWWDAIKLEESTVATPWSPGAIGATVIDAGGVQIDASRGGVFRLKGSAGGARDVVELGPNGLLFGGDTNLYTPSADTLKTDDALQAASLAIGANKVGRWVFGFFGTVVTNGGTTTDTAQTNVEVTGVPATGVVAVLLRCRLRNTAGTGGSTLSIYHYDGTLALQLMATGVANRDANGQAIIGTGGTNSRQFKWATSLGAQSSLYDINVVGYLTQE